MADIPSNLSYGTVTGRFLLAYADSDDESLNPDAVPAQGTVYFTPSPNYIKDVTATPAPVTILPASIECELDEEGYVIGYTGDRGVRLIATDDPQGNPVDWTWSVEFRLTDASGTPVRTIGSFSFELPGGTTVDLTSASPVPGADGTYYTVGLTGPANELTVGTVSTGAPGSDAEVEITGTAPDQTINFVIPEGDKGDAGEMTIGTVTTGAAGSSASVTNVGTTSDAILDFSIPRGDKGEKGDTGETGATGPTGATGLNWQGTWSNTTDYVNDDAVYYNGASWFASGDPTVGEEPTLSATHWMPLALQGATGATGSQGPQGIQGEQGEPGSLENLTAVSPIVYNSTTSTLTFDPSDISEIDGGTA
jgi:hypothetical protein